jgi:AsmA protein
MKRAAIIALVVLVVLAIVVALLPFVIPGNFLRDRMVDRFARLTGRTVAITGEPTLALYPHIALTADGLTIGNPRGMGDDPFIASESVTTRLRFLPLFIGRVEFYEVDLNKPRIHFVTDNNGRANWRPPGARPAPVTGKPKPPTGQPRISTTRPVLLSIVNGTIVYDDLASDRREEMADVDLDMTWPRTDVAASVRGTLQWRGEAVDFNASATDPVDLIRGGTSAVRFSVAATPLRIQFNGKATGDGSMLGALTLDGDSAVTTPSLRRTIEWLGTPMGPGSILGTASVRGHLAWADSTASFEKATLELDGNSATGTFSAAFGGVRPNIAGKLTIDSLDLSAYLESTYADVASEGSWVIAPARIPFATALDADVQLAAAQVLLGGIRVGRTNASMTVKNGSVALEVNDARLYGGSLEAKIGARMDGDALSGKAQVTLAGVPAELALSDLANVSSLSGSTNAAFDLAARGRIWGEFVHDIGGIGQIEIGAGSLHGFDAKGLAAHFVDPLAEPVAAGSGVTAFTSLTAGLVIGDGTMHTDNLAMTGKDFQLTLAGRGSVLSGAVDARATLSTADRDVPLVLSGTWREAVVARDDIALRPSLDEAPGKPAVRLPATAPPTAAAPPEAAPPAPPKPAPE